MAGIGRRFSSGALARRALGLMQRGAARHLAIAPAAEEVRRGEKLSVTVTADPGKVRGGLEVGLRCTETYASFMPQGKLGRSDRMMEDAIAYEHWLALEGSEAEHTVELDVPADAPYSYDGKHLRFTWRVAVRQRKERGLDPTRTCSFRVLP